MTPDAIEQKVFDIVCRRLRVDRATIHRQTRFDDLGLIDDVNSIWSFTGLISRVATGLKVRIPEADVRRMKTIGELVDFVVDQYGAADKPGEAAGRDDPGAQCKQCLRVNRKGARFCAQCGKPLASA